jgi:hypothetical protein
MVAGQHAREGKCMDQVRYPVSAERNDTRAYRYFFGTVPRPQAAHPSPVVARVRAALLCAQAALRWRR